jgi:hypothetical protein
VLLEYCINGTEPLPLDGKDGENAFAHLFKVGDCRAAVHASVTAAWKEHFKAWPPVQRVAGDSNVLNFAGTQLHTNFEAACVHAFVGRLKHHVARWAATRDMEVRPVVSAIMGTTNVVLAPAAATFVAAERDALGLKADEVCTSVWRKTHLAAVVRYFYRILCAIPANDDRARRFTLAPVASVKRHFVTLDGTVLCSLLTSVAPRLVKGRDIDAAWAAAFKNIDGLRGGKWQRGASVQTDGVSLCVRLLLPGAAVPKPPRAERRRGAAAPAGAPAPAAPVADTVVLAVDPGRRSPMHCVARHSNGTDVFYALSAAEFYHRSGKTRADARRATWEAPMAAVNAELSATSAKTASLAEFKSHVELVAKHHESRWRHRLPRRWAQESLRHFVLKHRAMDRWLAKVKAAVSEDGARRVLVAYGDARFSATGPGESLPAPTAFQFKRVELAFGAANVHLVDEYCTSKCCAACGARNTTSVLQNVYDPRGRVEGRPLRAVRGLKRRGSTECCSFVDRDANAALNIRAAFAASQRGAPRPSHLTRDNVDTSPKPVRFELRDPSVARQARRRKQVVGEEQTVSPHRRDPPCLRGTAMPKGANG